MARHPDRPTGLGSNLLGIVGASQRATTAHGIATSPTGPLTSGFVPATRGAQKSAANAPNTSHGGLGLVARFGSRSSSALLLLVGLRASSSSSVVVVTRPGTLRRYGVLVSSEGSWWATGCCSCCDSCINFAQRARRSHASR